jgi:hypothetical protein
MSLIYIQEIIKKEATQVKSEVNAVQTSVAAKIVICYKLLSR